MSPVCRRYFFEQFNIRGKQMALLGIINKEFYHIIRDFRTLIILFLMPLIQMVMFGYALNLEIQKVEITINDLDHSKYSRQLIRAFQGSNFFEIITDDDQNLELQFFKRKIRSHLTIPKDFSKKITTNQPTQVDFMVDASNSNDAILIEQYAMQTLLHFKELIGVKQYLPVEINQVFRFNPELRSTYFMVPGLLALLMIMITTMLTSITLVREKEMGTMTLLKISPLHSFEIIIGKVIPYLLLSLLVATIIILVGVFLFRVPVRGSVLLLYFFLLLYCLTGLSFGMMISSLAKTQQVAMLFALMSTILPTLILSGFIFPLASMPKILQYLSYIIPARYFLIIVRGIMLKDNTFIELLKPSLALIGFSSIFIIVSTKRFKTYLEQ
ncbi:ABC transporter permease [candidate division KSB1 bacterium]|nr:MAG: ABC transporter permease [candidate division KSB1 bacterium]